MIVIVGALALILFWRGLTLATVMLSGATLGFAFRIKPSENYWDYLIDPVIALFCCVGLLVGIGRHLRQQRPSPFTSRPIFTLFRGRQ